MKPIFIAVGVMCLMVGGASAADPKVDAAVKTFKQTENDPGKLKTFCEMTQAMNAAGEKEDAATEFQRGMPGKTWTRTLQMERPSTTPSTSFKASARPDG